MYFWQNLKTALGDFQIVSWALVVFGATALALYVYVPLERRRVRVALTLMAVALVLFVVAAELLAYLAPTSPPYIAARCVGQFLGAIAGINLLSALLFSAVLLRLHVAPPSIVQDLLVGIAYIVTAILLLSNNGLDVRGLVATSAVISAVIAFSLQDTLGNIMGGLALQVERTIRPGDWIKVDDLEGQVKEIRWRQTSIETREWDTVVIPNGVLMKAKVTLLGQRTGEPVIQRRRWIYFNIDFRYSPTQVIEAVEKALCAEPISWVAKNPAPHCILVNFKESYFNFAARYWLTDLSRPDPADSLVRTRIVMALRREGIPLSMPGHAVFLTKDSKSHQLRKRQGELARRTAVLKGLPLFKMLTEAELETVASNLRNAPFVRGEAMAQQGAVAHSLYIIVKGEATVHVSFDGVSREVAKLKDGDFFGEMGLMTGEPRTATVLAQTDAECYRVGRDGFEEILHSRPEIAEQISATLAHRRLELDQLHTQMTAEHRKERMASTQGALLSRIRSFFGLLGGDNPALPS